MAIKPVDVRRQEFRRSFRGYNADQVDDFLDSVADEYERSYTENARLREEVSSLRGRLEQFERLEDSIRAALVRAEQAAEDMRKSASQEAESLVNNANREAGLIVQDADNRSQRMLAETSSTLEKAQESYEALKKARTDFASDFRHLLKSYLDVMDNADVTSARDIEKSLRERLRPEATEAAREAATRQTRALTDEGDLPPEERAPEESQQAEPETTEPEYDPAPVEASGQDTVETTTEAEQEVEREEPPPGADRGEEAREQDPDDPDGDPDEGASDSRISRAGRFLRRRD